MPPAVVYEQVATMAEELKNSGRTPTARTIRQMVGDVGSLGTIQRFLTTWQSAQIDAPSATRVLSSELQRSIFKFVDEEVSRINAELKQELDNCNRAMTDIAVDNERQTALVRQLEAELAEQAKAMAEQDGRLARLLDELGAANNETSRERRKAELARIELAKTEPQLKRLGTLETECSGLRAALETQRQACVRAEQNAAVFEAQKADLKARLAEMNPVTLRGDHDGAGGAKSSRKRRERATPASKRDKNGKERTDKPSEPSAQQAEGLVAQGNESHDPRQAQLC